MISIRWVALVAIWTILSGPIFVPAPSSAPKAVKAATAKVASRR